MKSTLRKGTQNRKMALIVACSCSVESRISSGTTSNGVSVKMTFPTREFMLPSNCLTNKSQASTYDFLSLCLPLYNHLKVVFN